MRGLIILSEKTASAPAPSDAAYFSLVTITTLGYGEYTPQCTEGRKLVMCELLSGALLPFFAFPVLGSRLAQFDEETGTVIRRREDGSWEVQEPKGAPKAYPKSDRLTVTLGAEGMVEGGPNK
jgi:Ion channel